MNRIVQEDLRHIYEGLTEEERNRLRDSTVLVTGGAGFLGFSLLGFLAAYREKLQIRKLICLDVLSGELPRWLQALCDAGKLRYYRFDIARDTLDMIPDAAEVDTIIHMASIASPVQYRRYPIETLDANVWGLRRLLDFYSGRQIRGLAFFSSSEVYGDPSPEWIPTPESYRGNVDCQGPRACYDESKRFGETMCYLYAEKYGMPITIIRSFNNYGPGMRLEDGRVAADFARAVCENRDIEIFSDGSPTRSFCYVSDATIGYLKCLLHASEGFETYNIGAEGPEISVSQFAALFREAGSEVSGYGGEIRLAVSRDADYLKNNPNRRCPSVQKARQKLGYCPAILPQEGIRRYLMYLQESREERTIW